MSLKHRIMTALSQYKPVLLAETQRSAAVMVILLTNSDDDIEIVLTQRAATLPTYPGDYSFPGGISDNEDRDLSATAIRETQEELSIAPDIYQLIGQLDDFHDRFGHLVRPFVSLMDKNDFEQRYQLSHDEIARLYYFSIHKLTQLEDDPELHAITRRRPSYAYREGDVLIWGLTASILVNLGDIILDIKHK